MADLFTEIFPITATDVDQALALLSDLEGEMRRILAKPEVRIAHARILREPQLHTWMIEGAPALSISILTRLLAEPDVQTYAATLASRKPLIGLLVTDKASNLTGEIVRITGKDEPVARVRVGRDEYDCALSALDIVIRASGDVDDLERFEIDTRLARRALQMKPATLAQFVKIVSEIPKKAGLLGSGFNSRERPELFLHPDFEANLRFDGSRVRPYNAKTLGDDFTACGVYRKHKAFKSGPVRIAAINTLAGDIDDFMEAMKRQLERQFKFTIELIRERKVKVPSRKNLASAVKVIEKEDAHIVLVFVPDDDSGMTDETTADTLKSLVVGKGIASHVIREATMNNPDAMAWIIMGILGKTGSVPFVLAEPMVYADYIVGLDIVHQERKDGDTVTAMARIYESDGTFVRYAIREVALAAENMLYVLVRDLLPQREFAGKSAIIHHSGLLSEPSREVLLGWAKAIKATFYPVEIVTENVPHLYALESGQITQPPWGSTFRLSETEALLVSSAPADGTISRPLYVRTTLPLTIESALHSVLVWTLLHYGSMTQPRLPVTILYSDVLEQWLAKGIMPESQDGTTPFWL